MKFDHFLTMDVALQGFFIGAIFAVVCVAYNKLVIGRFVKALIKAEASNPEAAKNFEALNIKKHFLLSLALRAKGTLRKIVFEHEEEDKKGFFYIPENKLYRAGRMYGGKDVDLLLVVAAILVLFIFFIIILLYVPLLLDQMSTFGNWISELVD